MTSPLATYMTIGATYFAARTYIARDRISEHLRGALEEARVDLEAKGEEMPALPERVWFALALAPVSVIVTATWPYWTTRRAIRTIREARA